jgi:hypothetical protein
MGTFGTSGGPRDYMPDRAEAARAKAGKLHRVLQAIQARSNGVRHTRILFRAYGPQHWRAPWGDFSRELAPLIEDTEAIANMVREDPTLSRAAAVDACVRESRIAGKARLEPLEAEASALLADASRAADAAFDVVEAELLDENDRWFERWETGQLRRSLRRVA